MTQSDWIVGSFLAALVVLMGGSTWMVFRKAGHPGWASLIPGYHWVVMLRVAEKSLWWLVPSLIPGVQVIAAGATYLAIARRFGYGPTFALGLLVLPWIFFPVLGFGGDVYTRDAERQASRRRTY